MISVAETIMNQLAEDNRSRYESLWIATVNVDERHAGTKNPLRFIITKHSSASADDIRQSRVWVPRLRPSKRRNGASLWHVGDKTASDLEVSPLGYIYSFRLQVTSKDLWRPRAMFIWGHIERSRLVRMVAHNVSRDGVALSRRYKKYPLDSVPLAPVHALEDPDQPISSLMIFVQTDGRRHSDSRGPLHLQIIADNEIKLDADLKDRLRRGEANFFSVEVETTLTYRELLDGGRIILSTETEDSWLPESLFVWSSSYICLVDQPVWQFGVLSRDESEGIESVDLPIERI